ncbi:hypothetical protein K440DRAFT_301218 [Wilcoxina mikolae CBS 423.85]|nr:hypothetical protein K440DRAFT_301218 [Wilcoxina mikolae CBS 423.85]
MDTGNPFGVLANSQPAGDLQVQLVGNPEPLDVEVENLGFLGLNRDKRVKLLPEGFPKDALPRSSSSLFAIANKRGLFAAAGPKSFVIGSTASLREAFTQEGDFTPQLAIPSPISISHIAFNADESHIILGASSGGLAVYSIDALSSSGDAKATFEVGTDGAELREVKPNPTTPELVAIVTMGGDVRMLDLNMRAFKTGADGSTVLKSAVGTVAWSKRGKQIVCGMGDGTVWQMTPEGEGKATLPAPPGLDNHYVSSIVWLENHLFITTHTPVPTGEEPNNDSSFHLLARKESGYEFTKLFDPSPPYGMQERAPPYFFTAQLRKYGPALDDMIMFTGTCSTDIGVLVRFSEQNKEAPANTFVVAQFPDDTRRAEMPLSVADKTDTSPIGIALDLSAKANVRRPVGGEEIEESPGPLPILMVLNYEGVLAAWNVVYNDAIQKGEKYSGMVIYESEQTQQQQQPPSTPAAARQMASPFSSPKPATTPAFGQSSFGAALPATVSPFAATTGGSAFSKPSFGAVSTFGQTSTPSSGSAFGQPSAFGATSSPWGAPSSTPAPAPALSALSSTGPAPTFGQPSQLGAASPASFGQQSQLGAPSATPTFGQPSTLGANTTTPALGTSAFGQSSFGLRHLPIRVALLQLHKHQVVRKVEVSLVVVEQSRAPRIRFSVGIRLVDLTLDLACRISS